MRNLSVKADFSKKRKLKRTDNKMQKIKYEFADGTTSEIEVTDELYALHLELVQQEKRNHWKETRRHISLNYLTENGIGLRTKPPILFPHTYGARTTNAYITQ